MASSGGYPPGRVGQLGRYMLKVGIVGLPNVGKSSLFNALTAQRAPSENYPFCTVDPNVGVVAVPDPRLDRIHELMESRERVPTAIQFVDIAGLVKGASAGEGLGNRFLAQIREVDAIAHVLRCFEDPDVTHVLGSVDPVRDHEIVSTELALADLETVERRLERVERKARSGEEDAVREEAVLRRLHGPLSLGDPARSVELDPEEEPYVRGLHLLTTKPVIRVCNLAEDDLPERENRYTRAVRGMEVHGPVAVLCAAVEEELAQLPEDEQEVFLEELGVGEKGLDELIRTAYHTLGLITFFTTGEDETRAWTVKEGSSAVEAAGSIHTDFQRGFIRAETIHCDDFVEIGSMRAARERGAIRSEGRDYRVRDGDIILVRFNV